MKSRTAASILGVTEGMAMTSLDRHALVLIHARESPVMFMMQSSGM